MRRRTAWPLLLALSALDGRRVAAEDTTEAAYQAAFTAKLNKQLREQQVLLRDKLNEAREALKAAVAANSPDVKRAGATSIRGSISRSDTSRRSTIHPWIGATKRNLIQD